MGDIKSKTVKESTQKTGLKRENFDKFYTKDIIVNLCYKKIREFLNINLEDLIIEPSAGSGAFINILKSLSNNNIFIDIKPEHEDIIESDFLKYDINSVKNKYNKIHIIGNPPFGRQSSLAIKFIKYSEFAHSISFILPRSFKKKSMQKYFPQSFHLICNIDLPDNCFLINNIEHNVPCVFQIWEKRNYNRIKIEKLKPINYEFVKIDKNPEISFRRVGVYAGKIDKNIEKSIQSHYFIKFNKKLGNIDDIIKKLNNIKFNTNNTVGPKSISKQEIIEEFNKILI